MPRKINFEITTPERVVFSDKVDEIVLPTPGGEIGILPGHIPLVSLLSAGEIKYKKGEDEYFLAVSGGFIEVRPDKVLVLADTAEYAEEINIQKAEEAKKAAEKLLQERKSDAREFAALSAKIEKELARLKVGRKRRRRNSPEIK